MVSKLGKVLVSRAQVIESTGYPASKKVTRLSIPLPAAYGPFRMGFLPFS